MRFPHAKPVIGMVHLGALPGQPRAAHPFAEVVALAVHDARALAEGGCDGVLVENFGDAPFGKALGPEQVAGLALATREVVRAVGVPVGVNALRNDGPAAMAIAALAGARFVRANVWSGAAWGDQGLLEGCARPTLELRRRLGAEVEVWADALVKHASHPTTLEQALADNERNRCDAHLLTGTRTGAAAQPEDLARAKRLARLPVWVASGLTPANVGAYGGADGFVVGTALQDAAGRVDPRRVEAFVRARDALR